jgi:hypothetical protein
LSNNYKKVKHWWVYFGRPIGINLPTNETKYYSLHYYNTKGLREPRVEKPVGGRKDFGKPETLPSALCYLPI